MDEKKAYLKRYQQAILAEQVIEEEIRQLRLDQMMPAINTDGMPHGTEKTDLSSYAVKMDELLEELKEELERKIEIRREITRQIRKLPNETEITLMRLRYIHGLKWEEIALKMCYTYRYVTKLHGRALEHFELP